MKQRIIKSLLGCAAAAALVAGLIACGADHSEGTVEKNNVTGATVTGGSGKVLATNTENGKFPLDEDGPYKSVGGKYTDMNGVVRNAPTLEADKGNRNVTPMTTLYKYADAATKQKLYALCEAAGVEPDTIVDEATIPAEKAALKKLNETVGEALTQLADGKASSTSIAAFLQNLATACANLSSLDDIKAGSTMVNLVTTAAASTPSLTVGIDKTKLTSIANATAAGATIPAPPATTSTPTVVTGTTGGSTGGTSIK
jgi:hypothetical protein